MPSTNGKDPRSAKPGKPKMHKHRWKVTDKIGRVETSTCQVPGCGKTKTRLGKLDK